MATVKVSQKYQVVIPKEIRESMGIKPGDEFEVSHSGGIITLTRVWDVRKLRGMMKGIDTTVLRDKDRF